VAVIHHEAPEQRCHRRLTKPIGVVVQGLPYTASDWSLGGFRIAGFRGKASIGEELWVQVNVSYQGLEVGFTAPAVVVRRSKGTRSELAARFLHLNERQRTLLSQVAAAPARNGDGASLLEAVARVEIPVTPISPVPTPSEAPSLSRRGQFLRRFIYSCVYCVLGLAIGLSIVLTLYWAFCRLDLDYGVVTLPLYPVISQDVASCKTVFVEEGAQVQAGQPLLELEDDLLTRDLLAAEILADTARVDVRTTETRMPAETEKLAYYQKIAADQLTAAKETVTALTGRLQVAELQLKRLQRLNASKSVSNQELENGEAQRADLNGRLMQAQAELRIAENANKAVARGYFYDRLRIEDDVPQLMITRDDARQRLKVAEERVQRARERARRLTYLAPYAGKVVKILKPAHSATNRGEALLIIEKAGEEPVIDAFVTQEEANYFSLGSTATVWLPAIDRTYTARVEKIDRTTGFLSEMQAHLKESQLRYNWRGEQDRSAYIQLTFVEKLSAEERQELSGGMPATVSVARRPALLVKIQRFFAG
jgi:multidrug resistance efflux pump